jgi:hypothetical protein
VKTVAVAVAAGAGAADGVGAGVVSAAADMGTRAVSADEDVAVASGQAAATGADAGVVAAAVETVAVVAAPGVRTIVVGPEAEDGEVHGAGADAKASVALRVTRRKDETGEGMLDTSENTK